MKTVPLLDGNRITFIYRQYNISDGEMLVSRGGQKCQADPAPVIPE